MSIFNIIDIKTGFFLRHIIKKTIYVEDTEIAETWLIITESTFHLCHV